VSVPPPRLEVRDPTGKSVLVILDKSPVTVARDEETDNVVITIGRNKDKNTVVLQRDSQRRVSRGIHCSIKRYRIKGNRVKWELSDGPSRNGTAVRNGENLFPVKTPLELKDGMVICIPSDVTPGDKEPRWELTFRDPNETKSAQQRQSVKCLKYDSIQRKLFRVRDDAKSEVVQGLRLQEHTLLEYMAQANSKANGDSVACKNDDLIAAIWGEHPDIGQPRNELARLVGDIRRKVGNPKLLVTETGYGYRLITCPSADSG
jgi:hypothetical protein